ncbi:hypothetical protein ANANG_G00279130 [Anguilla anguilla]|uniref:Uncharacterized protein n=1 Tax=Anguilla anguilla TaxID=7936 RepID=A0A9D3RKD1_ANGAN|nr:hypothetical protein ANANG_G00279130 [Anguilla anguilla]
MAGSVCFQLCDHSLSAKMAASLLRIGRLGSLKCLQQESWSSLRGTSAASLSTKLGELNQPDKKTRFQKAKGKTSLDTAQLLQYRSYTDLPKNDAKPAVAAVAEAGTAAPISGPVTSATAAPEVSAAAPEVAMAVPEGAPEVSAAAPEVAAVAPEVAEAIPEVVAAAPEVATALL